MSGEKTEKATPKRRQDARKEGDVLKSNEINNWFCIGAGALAFSFLWKGMFEQLVLFFTNFFSDEYHLFYADPDPEILKKVLTLSGTLFLKVTAVFLMTVMAAGLLSNFVQTGFMFIPKNIMPKAERISPLKGFKRIFSMQSVRELLISLLKTALVSIVGYHAIMDAYDKVYSTIDTDLPTALEFTVKLIIGLAFKIILIFAAVTGIDYLLKWFEREKRLKMSKQEIKDEYKMTEGNPEVKSRIRDIQRSMATMRMMQQVPLSDVVITNPTHYAIAIKYDSKKDSAPIVTAKGKDLMAQKIKETAKKHNVTIVENPPVAQALYKTVEIGREIPVELFNAVAEILAYIYKLKGRKNI